MIGGRGGKLAKVDTLGKFHQNSQPHAGVAQLVERNLAKVEVASSRLVSRSRISRESQIFTIIRFPFSFRDCLCC